MNHTLHLTIENREVNIDYNEHFATLVQLHDSLNRGAAENYRKRGRIYVDAPQIVGITGACENIDTLFKVGNRLDLPLFFTQTGQLALEQALQSFPGVFTVIHSGRDEESEDERHLRQFRLTEEEFDSTFLGMTRENYDEDRMYEALLESIQSTVQSMLRQVLADHEETLEARYGRNVARLRLAASKDFLRITYEDGVKLLRENGYPSVQFGDDLKAHHEARLVQILNESEAELPLFIMKYPKEIKFFNMKTWTADERLALSADLIFPYSGEGTGSAVREHDFERLRERLVTSTMYDLHVQRGGKYEDFLWYLSIMEHKWTNPHAGYGIGNERVMQFILGENDIRHASVFALLNLQTRDWNEERYGQAGVIKPEKPHVLLTIGRDENKQYLLEAVRALAEEGNVIFYATQNTHEFLAASGVRTSLVHKVSEIGKTPNIADLLGRKVFDLIINIPSRESVVAGKEFTDGKLIRKGAVSTGVELVTDVEVAAMVLEGLRNAEVSGPQETRAAS